MSVRKPEAFPRWGQGPESGRNFAIFASCTNGKIRFFASHEGFFIKSFHQRIERKRRLFSSLEGGEITHDSFGE